MSMQASELILNPNGSIYHLHLKPGDIATTIITVGDPERVEQVTRHFDRIELTAQHREFKTQTGYCNGKRLTVISTGIGSGNIDIVLNELDALVNIDFETRAIKTEKTQLTFIRVGTSGAIQPEIPLDSFIVSEIGVGLDNLLHFYDIPQDAFLEDFASELMSHSFWNVNNSRPYAVEADASLLAQFSVAPFGKGITVTNVGFYGPQGRVLRLPIFNTELSNSLASFRYHAGTITNLEMETAPLYGMSKLLGHKALSLNAILANRAHGTFSEHPSKTIETLISKTLEILTQ